RRGTHHRNARRRSSSAQPSAWSCRGPRDRSCPRSRAAWCARTYPWPLLRDSCFRTRWRFNLKDGAHYWNRTSDLFLTKEVLYRMSLVSDVLAIETKRLRCAARRRPMERETGIEPAPSAWKAEVLPLNYSRPEPTAVV